MLFQVTLLKFAHLLGHILEFFYRLAFLFNFAYTGFSYFGTFIMLTDLKRLTPTDLTIRFTE